MARTTFFTSANRAYELFVLPYLASVLVHNDDARVEICLEDADRFASDNAEALAILEAGFGKGRCHLRNTKRVDIGQASDAALSPNSVRFIQVPEAATEYTYIGDIDILVLESVSDKHLRRMAHTGRPYSNILRPDRSSLSGLHFTRSSAYYPQRFPADADLHQDEHLLYQLVVAHGLELPEIGDRWRPVHGYHLSLNRAPMSALGWGVDGALQPFFWHPKRWLLHIARMRSGRSVFGVRQRFNAYCRLQQHEAWRRVLPYFDCRYMMLLGLLDLALMRLLHDGRLRGRFSVEHVQRVLADRDLVARCAS